MSSLFFVFFFNDTATTEIYTLSLHDALPICECPGDGDQDGRLRTEEQQRHQVGGVRDRQGGRSEEHTSELQSHSDLVCRLLLEKKKKHTRPKSRLDVNRESVTPNRLPPSTGT